MANARFILYEQSGNEIIRVQMILSLLRFTSRHVDISFIFQKISEIFTLITRNL